MYGNSVMHALLFLLLYLATLLGNLLIVTVTTLDQSLHTPMYFFLRNLSVLDMCYISVTVPKACVIFLFDSRVISMVGCATQIFLVVLCATEELLFLTIMAHDRYVAICQPLQYPVIMNHQFCVQMSLASLLCGLAYSGFQTGITFQLCFCRNNVVHLFFCDIPPLLKLSCSNTFSNEISIFVSSVVIAGGCFIFIIISYVHIFSTVLKISNRGDRQKSFSTCFPHILVMIIFISSAVVSYMNPTSNSSTTRDMIISMFYSIVPTFLNPIIYSLRNKQIKEAVMRLIRRTFYSEK